jgi:hypothetical protein
MELESQIPDVCEWLEEEGTATLLSATKHNWSGS